MKTCNAIIKFYTYISKHIPINIWVSVGYYIIPLHKVLHEGHGEVL